MRLSKPFHIIKYLNFRNFIYLNQLSKNHTRIIFNYFYFIVEFKMIESIPNLQVLC
jgi:hypothetical protein